MKKKKNLFTGFDANGRKIHLSPEDRARHMHVIGSSGSGKSKFLEHMIREDIKNRQGLCLIDPHGTLYEDVVRWLTYHNFLDRDIILLNPSAGDYVIGFNPFARTEGDISVRVDYQITATIRAWGLENTDETPRLERWLRYIYQTLNERGETIAAAEYLIDFFEGEVRAYLTENVSQRMVRSGWRGISAARTPRQFDDELESTKNKLLRFLCSEQVYRFMGMRENNINLREIMDEGKILLVNLAESDVLSHDNARLFGSLLVNELFQLAKRRRRDEWGNPPQPFYLYIDEFQNFVTSDIAYILDQTRKFGLHLIVAHQRLGKLANEYPDVLDAVLTNVRTRAVFGGLSREAAKLVVEEMFVNQLNLREVKKAIYQIKFWPKYSRDTVYTEGHSSTTGYTIGHTASQSRTRTRAHTDAHGSSHTEGQAHGRADVLTLSQGTAIGSAEHATAGEGWFDIPVVVSTTESELVSSGEAHSHAESFMDSFAASESVSRADSTSDALSDAYSDSYALSESDTVSESVADIPIFIPVPFKELSSEEYWTLEEQIWRMSDALKSQFPRHCFIQIPGQKTQPMLVPLVKEYRLFPEDLEEYQRELYQRTHALPAADVDALLAEKRKQLKAAALEYLTAQVDDAVASDEEEILE